MRKVRSINFIYNAIFIIILIGCKGKSARVVIHNDIKHFTKFLQENDSIVFKNMHELKGLLPKQMHIIDSTLIIFNFTRNRKGYTFYNYSLNDNKLSKGYLAYGRGPNEVIGPFTSRVKDGKLWMHDITRKKIMSIEVDKALNDSILSFNNFSIQNYHYKIDIADSLHYLSVGDKFSLSKIQLIDLASQKTIKEYGKFTLLDEAPIDAVKDGYQSFILSKPSGNKVVLPYRYEDVVEIYDLKSDTSIAIQGPDRIVLDFKPTKLKSGNVYMVEKDTRRTYGAPVVTDKYIYLPYSGHRRGNRSEEERFKWNNENVIHVFDWEGNPIKKLVLDRYITSIAVSKDDKTLYSFDAETGYLIKANLDLRTNKNK
ncbi:BF3164 family lipoprotein [Flavivirga spongiicola]|uniref:TolB-like 6-bladed beta-propeller domain-containing protein n=1 Tax=Flavivirga spongiicola TaxID=421621 RepID=A0ABU7XN97_9FLAO|nr:BF3164 family lipoprotein [Flavivirga sp. MEBiC05379]MDO5981577.1 BF3164 family lipoprotein [Flavivirga sp. MEBiC05379]